MRVYVPDSEGGSDLAPFTIFCLRALGWRFHWGRLDG